MLQRESEWKVVDLLFMGSLYFGIGEKWLTQFYNLAGINLSR